jgi:hypothetical protein
MIGKKGNVVYKIILVTFAFYKGRKGLEGKTKRKRKS